MVSQRHGGSWLVGFQNQIFETVSLVMQVDILIIVVLMVIILGILVLKTGTLSLLVRSEKVD